MVNEVKMIRNCAYIVSGVICAFSILYLVRQQFALMALLLFMGLIIVLPCRSANEENISFFMSYLIISTNIAVCAIQTLTNHFTPSAPLYICIGALAMLFFSIPLVRLSFTCSVILFLIETAILCLRKGGLIEEPMILFQCFLTLIVGFILIQFGVKTGLQYLSDAHLQKEEAEKIAGSLSAQTVENETMMQTQKTLLTQIIDISSHVSSKTKNLANESEHLAFGATQQAASIEEVYATIEAFSSQMKEASTLSQTIQADSDIMNQNVNTGELYMKDMLSAVNEIAHSMRSIENIIKTVNDIAFQTNILALNAAVEAARAGSAGKGFAVVADEVRALASNSAHAAEETMEVLSNCQNMVNNGTEVAMRTSDALGKIKESVQKVANSASEISTVTKNQSNTMEEIKGEINQISNVVQATATSAEQMAAMVKEISYQADQLDSLGHTKI